jgi:glutathione S-transferase
MSGRYTLYGRHGGGSIAVQFLLETFGIPHDIVWVTHEEAAQPEYKRINPTGKIPALVLPDGATILESAAICLHLTNTHPGLSPEIGTTAHAKYMQWMVFLSANLYEAILRIYYAHRYSAGGDAHAADVKQQALLHIDHHLSVIEASLSPYLSGDTVTAADLYLIMLLSWLPDGVPASMPKLKHLAETVGKLPVVERVMAQNA